MDAAFLLVNFAVQAFLAANHHVPRHWVYFIPSFLIYALWAGEGAGAAWQGLEKIVQSTPSWLRSALLAVLAVALLVWPLLPFRDRYTPLRQAHLGAGVLDPWRQTLKLGYMGDRMGSAISGVASNAVIICDWEQATTLWYFQQVEGQRPDVQIVYPVERLDEAAARGHPLYVTRPYGGLSDRWHLSCSDSLIALQDEPSLALPGDALPLSVRLGETFELAGYGHGHPDGWGNGHPVFHPGSVLPLTVHWRAVQVPAHDYSVSLRLFEEGGDGERVFQTDSQHPVLGTYPTSRWSAGEVVSDYYEIQLAPDLPPGTYRWGVILYRALSGGGWESLKVDGTDGEIAMGAAFEVVKR